MLVLFQAGNNKFGILKSHVVTIESDSTAKDHTDSGPISTVTLDGETMPRFDLSMLLGKGASSQAEENRRLIIATTQEGTVALKVDKVEDSVEIKPNQILPMPAIFVEPAIGCFPSVLRLQDDLIPLLDPNGIPKDITFYKLEESENMSADSPVTKGHSQEPPANSLKVEAAETIPEEETEETDISVEEENEIPAPASLPDPEDNLPLPEITVDQNISLNGQLTETLHEIAEPQTEIKESTTPSEEIFPASLIRAEGPLLVIDQQPADAPCPQESKPEAKPSLLNEPVLEESQKAEKIQPHPLSANEEDVGDHEASEFQDAATDIADIPFEQAPDLQYAELFEADLAEGNTEEDPLDDLTTDLPETPAVKEEDTLELSSLEKTLLDRDNEVGNTELSPAEDLIMPTVNGKESDIRILAPEDAVSLSEREPPSSGLGKLIRRFSERRAKKRAARRRTLNS